MAKQKTDTKSKTTKGRGRPTLYKKEYADLAYKFSLLGATDDNLAEFFDVQESTINNWKKSHKEFMESIKRGKHIADSKVSEMLYKRATGFKFDEVTFEKFENTIIDEVGNVTKEPGTKIKTVKKLIVPDTTAQIFWLKNRQPKLWRDKQEVDHTTGGEKINIISLGSGINPEK